MQARDETLLDFLDSRNDFIIPVYQRNYAWEDRECKKLWEDILAIDENNLQEYFMGAFVVVPDKINSLLVVDGQQRLTTLSLILLAIRNLLETDKIKSEDKSLKEKISDLLTDKYNEDKEKRIKLKQVNMDSQAYIKLFDLSNSMKLDGEFEKSLILPNYKKFEKRILDYDKKRDVKIIYDALRKIKIVKIELDLKVDKPQLVFEGINATGKALTDADKIRNFVLMDQNDDTQERLFREYWEEIEKNTFNNNKNKSDTSEFIRHFLMYRYKEYVSKKNVYDGFKNFIKDDAQDQDVEACLRKILTFSGYYKEFTVKSSDGDLEKSFEVFRNINQTTAYPYMFHLMEKKAQKELDKEELCKILRFLESYYIRRLMLGKGNTGYSQIFPTLAKKINNQSSSSTYADKVYTHFANNLSGNQKFVLDEEFIKGLPDVDFYSDKNKKNIKLFLGKIINSQTKEKIDINKPDAYSIEHIMPQTLTEKWRKDLGENYQEIHEKFVNTIGNLTVTAYNSELSNKPFHIKKRDFYAKSSINITRKIAENEKWGESEIRERSKDIARRICSIWASNDLRSYREKIDNANYKSVEFIISNKLATGNKLEEFIFLGERFNVSNWSEMSLIVFRELCKYDSDAVFDFASGRPDFSRSISRDYEKKICDNLYLNVQRSAIFHLKRINEILDKLNINDELKIRLKT